MALLEMRGVYKTFNAGTPDEVRALRGLRPDDRAGQLRRGDRHQRVGQEHDAQRRGRIVSRSMPARSAWPAAS